MRIDLLCSGSKGNACLVRTARTQVLIDCGASTKKYLLQALEQAGTHPDALDALLITHSHSDHIKQLRHFAHRPIYTCCQLAIRDSKGRAVSLDLHFVQPPETFTIGDLTIRALPTSHDSGPSMGFVIKDDHSTMVYITDTGYLPAALYPEISGADHYIFESNHDLEMLNQTSRPMWLKQRIACDTGHLCNQDSARILSFCITPNTKDIVLAHLSDEANTPELALRTLYERLRFTHFALERLNIQAAAQFEILTINPDEVSSPMTEPVSQPTVEPVLAHSPA